MSTTVRQLIEKLEKFHGDLIVGVASDEEGNRVFEFAEVTLAVFDPEKEWGDQFGGYIYTEDDEGYEEETEVSEETANAIIIWP